VGIRPAMAPLPPLVKILPLHYDALFASLGLTRKDCAALEAEGKGWPLILIIGDIRGASKGQDARAGRERECAAM